MPNKKIIALEKELESLRLEPPGSEFASVLNKLAYACLHLDPRRAEVCAVEAKNLAEKQGFLVEQAKSCNTLGTINMEAGKFAEAMSYCQKSMEISEELEDKNGMASVHGTKASIYRSQGMIDKALEHFHESLRLKQECGAGEDELAVCYLNIGTIYSGLFRLDLAQSFYEYARSIWEKSGDRMKLAYIYNNIGSLYGKKEEFDKAREYFQKALDIREDLGDVKGTASTLGNLGSLHEKLGDNESALKCFIRSLELYEEIGNKRGVAYTCGCVGGVYTALGRLEEAESLISRGLSITRKLKLKDWEIHCLDLITKLYEAKGDLQKALSYSRELNRCVEEHLNEKSLEKIAGLQVQFETEKKEKEAEIYRLKNVELSRINNQLRDALVHVKKLQGLLPICANCKKVRDDDGYWQQIESYVSDHSDATFSHGICPECMIKLYGK
ncbi:MAG: tetratricopeptide repeat protein, partial [Candidatus Aegiribacteria sp.]|nr:tetratricopeptide repeat protein [Candidatus Aegiribacteria sp.]